jgi:NAD(P)-dependent dehydrogenase (short-subunit alcohol dehydrogenase family)
MTERLAGRTVVITGAASGIGRATARRAAAEGATVVAIDIDADGLATLGAAVTCVADVRDEAALRDALAGVGTIDVVHANAGVLPAPTTVAELDLDEWHRVLDTNLTGALRTFRAALPHVPDGGVLLATGSSLASRPNVGQLPYVAAKAGLHAMARSLALELAPRRIRVNVVAPGLTETPMVRAIDGHVDRGLPTVPLGVLAEADDVAALAVHLMTDDARAITGAVFPIDGGRTAG